ncbi:hypothetical protein AYO49_00895 [Verrucomicrobiaceae bacterium SCGC AG-212-N21]|nr:hypothetical protein AYO49_00895 [Verrucomicrobiaceae bacterium SCGC AG-212-N21]
MSMKTVLLCGTFLVPSLLFAVSTPELDKLTEDYQKAVARAVSPITQSYEAELKKLQERYTKAGNLDAALEVRKVIDQVAVKSVVTAAASSPKPTAGTANQGDSPVFVTPTKWTQKAETTTFTYSFEKNGSGLMRSGAGVETPFTWEQNGTEVVATLKGLNTKRHFVFENTRRGVFWFANKPEVKIPLAGDR